jgi:hypothetical protein
MQDAELPWRRRSEVFELVNFEDLKIQRLATMKRMVREVAAAMGEGNGVEVLLIVCSRQSSIPFEVGRSAETARKMEMSRALVGGVSRVSQVHTPRVS